MNGDIHANRLTLAFQTITQDLFGHAKTTLSHNDNNTGELSAARRRASSR
jgi:hypothetical protein